MYTPLIPPLQPTHVRNKSSFYLQISTSFISSSNNNSCQKSQSSTSRWLRPDSRLASAEGGSWGLTHSKLPSGETGRSSSGRASLGRRFIWKENSETLNKKRRTCRCNVFLEFSMHECAHGFVSHLLEEGVTNQSTGVRSVGGGRKKKKSCHLKLNLCMFIWASRENNSQLRFWPWTQIGAAHMNRLHVTQSVVICINTQMTCDIAMQELKLLALGNLWNVSAPGLDYCKILFLSALGSYRAGVFMWWSIAT